MIEAHGLTKRYGEKTAVADLSFTVRPGVVTGFLGPNGAGKSTTMRMILGLDAPSAGRVTVNGKVYREHRAPLREVGAMLESHAIHTGRSAYNHLLSLAVTTGIPRARVDEVIDLVGLRRVAGKRAGGFSLGMTQRLGIATALLGDPATVILDEPVNGLDPEGVRWIRTLLRELAAQGRTVLVSSHLMSEMALTAGHLLVIGRGRLLADTSVEEFTRRAAPRSVLVRTDDADGARRLWTALTAPAGIGIGIGPGIGIGKAGSDGPGSDASESLPAEVAGTRGAEPRRAEGAGSAVSVTSRESGVLEVSGLSSRRIGRVAADHGIVLAELTPRQASLEEAFMELTRDDVEYQTTNRPANRGANRAMAGDGLRRRAA